MPNGRRRQEVQKRVKRNHRPELSILRKTDEVVAIFLADIHLSLKPPIWRSAEPNWFQAMDRPLNEIRFLQQKYNCPVIYAGDLCEWNCSPELINFALEYLPDGYGIPGQHDLPLHNYEDIGKSAYWTLVKAGKIQNMCSGNHYVDNDIAIYPFPFGHKIKSLKERIPHKIHIAVVHEYVCIKGKDYPEAPKFAYLENRRTKFTNGRIMGYDVIVYGDNHKGFSGLGIGISKKPRNQVLTEIFNCGTLMRRKSDEIDYIPQIGLLLSTGKVVPYYLDTSKDKYLESVSTVDDDKEDFDMSEFIEELGRLGNTALDFAEKMKQAMRKKKVKPDTKQVILEAMEE